jgi:Fe-S cluster biogenesis protein NfuA
MFIQTLETPNPATLKFMVDDGDIILENGSIDIKNQQQAAKISPLALQIFALGNVEAVFLGQDFITVTKNNQADWQALKLEVQAVLMDFFLTKKPLLYKLLTNNNNQAPNNQNNDPIIAQIIELIEIKVRPAVAMDGGDIVFHSFENGIVKLVLKGSCSGCPSSTITLKNGIENMLKHYIPEVELVEQVEED